MIILHIHFEIIYSFFSLSSFIYFYRFLIRSDFYAKMIYTGFLLFQPIADAINMPAYQVRINIELSLANTALLVYFVCSLVCLL